MITNNYEIEASLHRRPRASPGPPTSANQGGRWRTLEDAPEDREPKSLDAAHAFGFPEGAAQR